MCVCTLQETDEVVGAIKAFTAKVPIYLHPNPANRLRGSLKKGEAARYRHVRHPLLSERVVSCVSHACAVACALECALRCALHCDFSESHCRWIASCVCLVLSATTITALDEYLVGYSREVMHCTVGSLASCAHTLAPLHLQAIVDVAETCVQHGTALAECAPDSLFGKALLTSGEGFGQCRDFQYGLDDDVNQMFLSPLKDMLERDVKELQVCVDCTTRTLTCK